MKLMLGDIKVLSGKDSANEHPTVYIFKISLAFFILQ